MRYGSFVALSLVLLFPVSASADIFINEVAWMGTDTGGGTCEWIELYNSDDEIVDLTGWTLTIRNTGASSEKVITIGTEPETRYTGINANGYYLLAHYSDTPTSRTCKDAVPGPSADWIGAFGNGIGNSGAKLTLADLSGVQDTVESSKWDTAGGLGGKNTAPKETPQKSGAAWVTALPTPRGPNHAAPLNELPEDDDDETPPVVTIGGTAPLVPVTHPIPKLYVEAGPARILVAGADSSFRAIAYDSLGTLRKNADITWSFGDGGQEKGDEVAYAYKKPGEYTAVVRARDRTVSAIALIPIVVTDTDLAITDASDEGVTLTNASDRLVDLSGWKMSGEQKTVTLPPDTVIAAGASVFFSYETLRLPTSTEPALKFPNGRLAHAYAQPSPEDPELQQVQAAPPAQNLAVNEGNAYVDADFAPAAQATLAAAGAAVGTSTEPVKTVILKDDQVSGFGTLFASLAASVISLISPN